MASFSMLLLALISTSSAFKSNRTPRHLATHMTRSSNLDASKEPLVVVGSIYEALGASMAMCARDAMLHPHMLDRSSPVPPAQCIAFYNTCGQKEQRLPSETIASLQNALQFLGPNLESYEKILANSLQLLSRIDNAEKQMLYTSLDFGSEQGVAQMTSLSMVCKRFEHVGLNLNTNISSDSDDERFIMSREQADVWGNRLQSVLDETNKASITMDIRTHLAMLQSNSLPKLRINGPSESDVWAIKDTIRSGMHTSNDGILFEYQYNYQDSYGGSDPLMCPSMGYVVTSSDTGNNFVKEWNDVYAAAYSANIGSGLDKLSSMCIATSIRSLFNRLGTTPPYSWKTIDHITKYTIQAGQSIQKENGLPRKMYKDFGYK